MFTVRLNAKTIQYIKHDENNMYTKNVFNTHVNKVVNAVQCYQTTRTRRTPFTRQSPEQAFSVIRVESVARVARVANRLSFRRFRIRFSIFFRKETNSFCSVVCAFAICVFGDNTKPINGLWNIFVMVVIVSVDSNCWSFRFVFFLYSTNKRFVIYELISVDFYRMLKHVQVSPQRSRADSVSISSTVSLCSLTEPLHSRAPSYSSLSENSGQVRISPSRYHRRWRLITINTTKNDDSPVETSPIYDSSIRNWHDYVPIVWSVSIF